VKQKVLLRLALLLAALAVAVTVWASLSAADDFTVVLIPDTQYYTTQPPENNRYSAQTQWIKNNAASLNIKFAIHLGDIVQDRNTVDSEWQIADAAHDILESGGNPVPYSVMPGNHDVLSSGSPDYIRDTSKYNQYFGPDRFASRSWYGGHAGTTNDNNYSFFSVGALNFMVLSLEPLPTDATLTWANSVVQSHPNHRVILATHVYLNSDGSRSTARLYEDIQGNNANDIFSKLVNNNPNIFLTVCGHRCYEALNTATNAAGKPVYEVLSDYQNDTNGGNGWLRTLFFQPSQNKITFGSYSPTLNQYNRNGTFSLSYNMGGIPPDPPTPAELVAYWDFDHGATDLVGDHDLTLRAGATIAPGRFGNGLHVTDDPTSGYASAASDPELNVSSKFSVALWMSYENSLDAYGRVVARMQDVNNGYNIAMADATSSASALIIRVKSNGTAYHVTTDTPISQGTFHHVAFSFDDTAGTTATDKIRVWIDGKYIVTTDTSGSGSAQGTAEFVLGKGTASTSDFAGTVDEVRFYNGVLTSIQIAALQHALIPGDANGDGTVDDEDADIVTGNWGQQVRGAVRGDFNNDGAVNAADAAILTANWGTSIVESTAVPEPVSLALLAVGALVLAVGRRRSCCGRESG